MARVSDEFARPRLYQVGSKANTRSITRFGGCPFRTSLSSQPPGASRRRTTLTGSVTYE